MLTTLALEQFDFRPVDYTNINTFISKMYKYQEKFDIKGKCFSNSFMLYHFIKNKVSEYSQLQIVPVFLLIDTPAKKYFVVHNMVKYNNKYYDSSYEFSMYPNKYIFENVEQITEYIKNSDTFDQSIISTLLKSAIPPFEEHKKCAEYYKDKDITTCDPGYIKSMQEKIKCLL